MARSEAIAECESSRQSAVGSRQDREGGRAAARALLFTRPSTPDPRPRASCDPQSSASVVTIAPRGSLVGEEAEALRRRLGEALALDATTVIVDLAKARYVSARALSTLVAILAELRSRGGDLKLLHAGPEARELFDLCDLGSLFEFLDSEAQAADSGQWTVDRGQSAVGSREEREDEGDAARALLFIRPSTLDPRPRASCNPQSAIRNPKSTVGAAPSQDAN